MDWLLLLALVIPADEPAPTPFDTGSVVEFLLPEVEGTRRETFRLDPPERGAADPPLGLVSFVARPRGEGWQLERHWSFFDIQTRVVHVEHHSRKGPRMWWREVRPRSGRTVLVEWDSGEGQLRCTDWHESAMMRSSIALWAGGLLPLFVLEQARLGAALEGPFDVFEPLAGTLVERRLRTRRWALPPVLGGREWRLFELAEADGRPGASYLFSGRSLLAFQLQPGGPVATRISEADHDRRLRVLAQGD